MPGIPERYSIPAPPSPLTPRHKPTEVFLGEVMQRWDSPEVEFMNLYNFWFLNIPCHNYVQEFGLWSGKFATGINKSSGTGGKIPVVHLYLRFFDKILNDPNVIFMGLGEDDSMKKTWSKKSRYTVPLKGCPLRLKILSYHNLFTKTFPFTIPITRYSFYDFFNTSQQQPLHLEYST